MHKRLYLSIIFALIILMGGGAAQANEKTSAHISRAKDLYRRGRWSDSRLELLKAKDDVDGLNPIEKQEIDFYLALCHVGLEDESALMRLNAFMSSYPWSIYTNQVEFNRGLLLCTSEEYKAARRALSRVKYSKLSRSEQEEYNMRMGYIAFVEGDYIESSKYLNRIGVGSEYYDHALYYRSYISYAKGDLRSAKEGFTRLTSSDAYGSVSPYYLLQVEFQLGNYQYVTSQGVKLIETAAPSQRSDIARTVAEANFRLENYEEAIRYISAYQKLGAAMSREDYYMLGFSLYRTTRYEAAQEHLKKASGADDALTQNASYHLADCYLKLSNKEGAMRAFAVASRGEYNAAIAEDALFNYGKLRYELGGGIFNEAINTLTRYIDKYPNSNRTPEVKKLLVAAYYNSSNYDAAYKAIKEVKKPDAEIRSALQKITYFKALEAMQRGDVATAKANFKESEDVGISPKYTALARFWQGEIDYNRGEYNAALKNFNSYLARAPKGDKTYAMAHYSTAYALLKCGNEKSALRYFRQYLTFKTSDGWLNADAHNRIGDILYSRRQFTEASKSYYAALKIGGESGYYAKYQISMVDGIKGNAESKIKGLRSIISTNRGEYVDDAAYELGRTYMSHERYKEAVQSLEHFINNYSGSPKYLQALSDLGLSHLNLGDRSASINYYDRVIKEAPQSAVSKDALQGIREIYIDQGDANGYFDYVSKMGLEHDLGVVAKDSLSFASAQRLYLSSKGEGDRVAKSLSAYVTDYPNGFYLNDALFMLSDCHLKNGDSKEAIESLTQLSERGANQYTYSALDRLSQLTFKEGDFQSAASAYRKLFDVSKSDTERAVAMDGYATSILELKDRDRALEMANDVLSQSASGDKAMVKAKQAKANILRENGEWTEAVILYSELSKDPLTEVGAEATYYLISHAYREGNKERAEGLIFGFAESQTTQAYWLARAFILLGDIYVSRDDSFQARATYQSIVDGYAISDDGVIEEAKSKIEKLK